MEKRYEKDPINGKWYEVKKEGFTNSEWQEFQERWGKKKKEVLTGHEVFWICFFASMFVLMFLKAWGWIW